MGFVSGNIRYGNVICPLSPRSRLLHAAESLFLAFITLASFKCEFNGDTNL